MRQNLLKQTMMKTKRNWFIIAIAIVMTGSLTSCLDNGQNAQDFQQIPSFMTQKDGNWYMQTLAGNAYASGLSSITTDPYELLGSYGISWFNINYDNQKEGTNGSDKPYTATVNAWLPVKDRPLNIYGGELSDSYSDTILSAGIMSSSLLNNRVFLLMGVSGPSNRTYQYNLTLNTDSTAKQNNVPALYVQGNVLSEGSGTKSDYVYPFAFDMEDLIEDTDYNKEVTIQGVVCQQVSFNLYYQSGIDKTTGKPIFVKATTTDNQPLTIIRVKPN